MGLSLREQLLQLCAGMITGAAFGVSMDVYRTLRRFLAGPLRALADVTSALLWGAWLFALGMGIGGGGRLFLLAAAGLGWAVYLWGLSEALRGWMRRLGGLPALPRGKAKKKMRNGSNTTKKIVILRKKTRCKK